MDTVPAPSQTRIALTSSEIGLAFIIPLFTIAITVAMVAYVIVTSKATEDRKVVVIHDEKQRIPWQPQAQILELQKAEARKIELRQIEIRKVDAQKAEARRIILQRAQSEKRRKGTAVELDSNEIHEIADRSQLSPKSARTVVVDVPPKIGHAI